MLEERCRALRAKIEAVKKRRAKARNSTDEVLDRKASWTRCLNEVERERSVEIAKYDSIASRRASTMATIEVSQKWNVTNDAFHIWHRGPFGTINGLRLGSEVPHMPSSAAFDNDKALAKPNAATGPPSGAVPRLDFDISSLMFSGSTFLASEPGSGGTAGGRAASAGHDSFKVSWPELNSALGLSALLLSTLERKPNSGIHFRTHEIIPLGSFSKIGVLQGGGQSPILYPLYSDDSFQFFGKRNFNVALNGLLTCLADAADQVARRDRTIALPHAIESSSRGELTIGGLPISFGTDGERWTRAMKYFLTDLKWLVAFTTKHVDR